MEQNLFMFKVKGLNNYNNSCFIDTVLMSMYGYSRSPFLNFLDYKWNFVSDEKDEINNGSVNNKDLTIRKDIQKILKITMTNVIYNKPINCSVLRNNIETFFKWKNGNVSNNLDYGQQDVSEFYDRIIKIFNFNPITITNVRQSKIETDGKIIKEKSIKEKMGYISIQNDQTDFNGLQKILNPNWEDLGEDKSNWKYNKKNKPTYRWTRNVISSIKGDNCLIFHVNRTSAKIINGEYISYKTQNKITMPSFVNLSGVEYFLFSTIVHLSSGRRLEGGHYITIFFDTKDYYIYDDMDNNNIENCKIGKEKIINLIERNNVMHFYYPITK